MSDLKVMRNVIATRQWLMKMSKIYGNCHYNTLAASKEFEWWSVEAMKRGLRA